MIKTKLEKIFKHTPKLLTIFLYLQPILDIIAAYLINNNYPNYITSVIRLFFMFYLILFLFLSKYENKKKIVTHLCISLLYILIHMITILIYKDSSVLLFELRNTLSTFYFIFFLLTFISINKENQINKKHLFNIFLIYLSLTFIPNILNISYESYGGVSKVGKSGLFYSANTLGSILIIILSSIILEIKKLKKVYIIPILLITIYVIFTLGTKTPVLGLLFIVSIYIMYYLYQKIKEKNKKPIIITCLIVLFSIISSIYVLPKTNFYENIKIHLTFLKNQENMNTFEYIDHFIFSSRFKKEKETRKYYNNSKPLEKLFGIGYIEDKKMNEEKYKTIEIDYFDIFYREGIIGFIIYFIPLMYILIQSVKKFKFNLKNVNNISTIMLIILLAFFQGHIFVTPSVSIFVSLLIIINSMNISEKEV